MAATKHNVDFTNVKEGGNFSKKHMPEGEYLAKITKVEDAKPKDPDDHTPMWLFTIQIKGMSSATYPYYCKLQDNQLWKVRNLLVAAGINVPKKRLAVDPSKLVGKMIGVVLADTEYNGKAQSEIDAVISPNEIEGDGADAPDDVDEPDIDTDEVDDEPEDETPEPAPKKKKAKPAPEPEEDEEDDEPEPPKKKSKKKAKPAKAEADDEIDIEDLD